MDFKEALWTLGFSSRSLNNHPTQKKDHIKILQSSSINGIHDNHSIEHIKTVSKSENIVEKEVSNDDNFSLRLTSSISTQNNPEDSNAKSKKRKLSESAVHHATAGCSDEQVSQNEEIRRKHKIYVWGTDVAKPCETFEKMFKKFPSKSRHDFAENLTNFMFDSPTPIQIQAIPVMLKRREILACAPTGSGKTMAFILPILAHLTKSRDVNDRIKAVILEPTREMAHQTFTIVERMCQNTDLRVSTPKSLKRSKEQLAKESLKLHDILVSTPKRLVSMLKRNLIKFNKVEWLVVDESDKMFESGPGNMRDQLGAIYKACDNVKLRRAFFSATFSYEVEEWCKANLDNVVTVCVGKRNSTVETVEQELKFTGDEYGKLLALKDNLRQGGLCPPVLIFVQTKSRAEQLYGQLCTENIRVDLIHSERNQEQRNASIANFRCGRTFVLICTELLGRGVDFKGVNVVVNYDFPPSPISYIHRIGRTGRAGRQGKAITFFTEADKPLLRSIANVMKTAGCKVPNYMLDIPKPDKSLKKKLSKMGVKRKSISLNTTVIERKKKKKRRKIFRKQNNLVAQTGVQKIGNEKSTKIVDGTKNKRKKVE